MDKIYEDAEKGIKVISPQGRNEFYNILLASGTSNPYVLRVHQDLLDDLTDYRSSTRDIKRKLQQIEPDIELILSEQSNVSFSDLYVALLKIRIRELEIEISDVRAATSKPDYGD